VDARLICGFKDLGAVGNASRTAETRIIRRHILALDVPLSTGVKDIFFEVHNSGVGGIELRRLLSAILKNDLQGI
jgi:hypothetical protein